MGNLKLRLAVLGLFLFPTISLADAVGSTPGGFSVSPTGAAQYTIPIAAPPGRKGLQPGIALTYNSNAGLQPFAS